MENAVTISHMEVDMTRPFPPLSSHVLDRSSFAITDFEPLLDSTQAARLLQIHPKTLQKMARRGQIHGTHVGKLWRFRASDLDDLLYRQERGDEK